MALHYHTAPDRQLARDEAFSCGVAGLPQHSFVTLTSRDAALVQMLHE